MWAVWAVWAVAPPLPILPILPILPPRLAIGLAEQNRYFQQRYLAHKYWGRRPWYVVRALIEKHSAPGEVVLDSFCGSGTTLVEALAVGRRAIGVDLNPIAEFICRVTLRPVETPTLVDAFERLRAGVEEEIHRVCAGGSDSEAPRHWFPQVDLPISRFGVNSPMAVADLFTPRNLAAAALLWDAIETLECAPAARDLLRFTFTAALAQFTKMIRTKKEGTGWWVNAYRIPRTYRENDVWRSFENKFRAVLRMKEETNALLGPVTLATQDAPLPDASCALRVGSATELSFLPDESVDYVFIDPPWAIKYFDLSVLWCSWMGWTLPFEQEIFPWHSTFRDDMARALCELARVLRPGRVLTLNFATRYAGVLNEWREAIEASGLEWESTEPLQQDQHSFVQRQHDTTLKGNYLLTLRKRDGAGGAAQNLLPAVMPAELETMVRALLTERGPLTYDAIFQAVYPALAQRRLVCDLFSVLVNCFAYEGQEDTPYEDGTWSADAANGRAPVNSLGSLEHFAPPRPRREEVARALVLPFDEPAEEGAG